MLLSFQGLEMWRLSVLPEDAQYFALNTDAGCRSIDGSHLRVGRLKPNHTALAVEALQGGIAAVDEGYDNLSFAGGAGSLYKDVVAGDNVLIAHGITTDFQGKDFAVADNVSERDALCSFNGFYGLPCGNTAEERQAIGTLLPRAGREDIDRATSVVRSLQQAFVLQICDVFVNGGEGTQA